MSREVRRVPANWEHPKSYNGQYIGLMEGYADYVEKYKDDDDENLGADEFMPEWSEFEKTHYQMYETVSEGTPISPVLESPQILAKWLADNNAYAGGMNRTATYEQWLRMIEVGSAPSGVIANGKFMSGVEFIGTR